MSSRQKKHSNKLIEFSLCIYNRGGGCEAFRFIFVWKTPVTRDTETPSGQIDPISQHPAGDKVDVLDENKLTLQEQRYTDGMFMSAKSIC